MVCLCVYISSSCSSSSSSSSRACHSLLDRHESNTRMDVRLTHTHKRNTPARMTTHIGGLGVWWIGSWRMYCLARLDRWVGSL